jgi:sugar-specific transcriptional regulator TrmB
MELQEVLQKAGLNSKQAKIYLALLGLGKARASAIAQKANLKRPTVYVILEELINRGLANQIKSRGVTLFSAASPDKLIQDFKERSETLTKALPALEALCLTPENTGRPALELFEGEKDFEEIYLDFIKSFKPDQEVLIFSSLAQIKKQFSHLVEAWHKKLQKTKPQIREILTPSRLAEIYKAEIEKLDNPYHQIKLLPKELKPPKNEFLVYQDALLILNLKKEYWALKIKNPDIADSYRAMFKIIWKNLP